MESNAADKTDKNKQELEDTFVLYYQDILKYCIVRLKNYRDSAEDVTDNVFELLCKKWDSLKKDNIRAWLYRVADNLLKEFFRKQKKLLKFSYIEDLDLDGDSDFLAYEQNFESESDEDIYNLRDIILGKLSKEERKLFDMHFSDKKSREEICDAFSISEETLKKRLYRLKQKIISIVSKTAG